MFIDTSYYLRYYEDLGNEEQVAVLKTIEANRDRIVITEQVLVEFTNNRQSVLARALDQLKDVENKVIYSPPLFRLRAEKESLHAALKELNRGIQAERDYIERVLRDPLKFDPVYAHLLKMVRSSFHLVLRASNERFAELREAARHRCSLGYPPRKRGETSHGDALNWEWVVHCAASLHRDAVIVTRDGDYGTARKEARYVNDWLAIEFEERTGGRKLRVMSLLDEAFRDGPKPLSRRQAEAEKKSAASEATITALAPLPSYVGNVNALMGALGYGPAPSFSIPLSKDSVDRLFAALSFADNLRGGTVPPPPTASETNAGAGGLLHEEAEAGDDA
ncbi:MAG TPA: PIN domain-containing protein [Gemmatimonadaceae bacterium]|nr:PIN domain-containing protein [Gemmatimonadaceae bacterium]